MDCCGASLQELFDMFESNLNELRLAKLLVHQFFFRGMESFEAKCNDSLLGAAERILRQAVEDPSSFEHLSEDMIQVCTCSL